MQGILLEVKRVPPHPKKGGKYRKMQDEGGKRPAQMAYMQQGEETMQAEKKKRDRT